MRAVAAGACGPAGRLETVQKVLTRGLQAGCAVPPCRPSSEPRQARQASVRLLLMVDTARQARQGVRQPSGSGVWQRWSQSGGVSHPARHPGQTQTRPDLCQEGLARHGPRVAWLRGSVFRAHLNAQTEGCVSRRDLRLTTVRQGEQGRRGGHIAGLRPPDHRVCNHRCTGSIRAQESSTALRCRSATVTQAISSLVAAPSPRLQATIMRPTAMSCAIRI